MDYSGYHSYTLKPIATAKTPEQKSAKTRSFLAQARIPQAHSRQALANQAQ